MNIVVHTANAVDQATMTALLSERLHRCTNDPPYRPDPIEMDVRLNYCDPDDDHAYRDSLAALWQKGEQFINLESDVAPWPGALTELWECPQPWCVFAYLIHQAMNANGIGCVKFSSEFMAKTANVWTKYPRNDIYNWRSLDAMLLHEAEPAKPHVHTPPVLHLNRNHI